MEQTAEQRIGTIREFNRFYTNFLGLVNKSILASPYSLAEVRVMLEIDAVGQSTASDLSRLLQIDPGYLSRMLERFKKEQLVAKIKSATDRRTQMLSLTEKGRAAFRELSAASSRQIAALLDNLPAAEQETLVSHMTAIQEILAGDGAGQPVLRTCQPGDAGYIAYRHAVLYAREYGLGPVFEQYVLSGLAEFAANCSDGEIWVAQYRGRIVGSIGIVAEEQASAQLRWFLLEPEFRGRGLGQKLLTAALNYCRQKKYRRVFLWTFQELAAARHLYGRFGFVPTERQPNDSWKEQQVIEERWDLTLVTP